MRADYGGIVYIEAEYAYGGEPAIDGHWEPGENGDFVYGPGWTTAAQAIAWGRHRAPWVFFRVEPNVHVWRHAWVDGLLVRLPAPTEHRSVYDSAGEAHREDDEYVRWPAAADYRDEPVHEGYAGAVWLVQEAVGWWSGERIGYTARWEAESGGRLGLEEIVGPTWVDDLNAAIAWARERAPYVLVHEPGAGYESAGVRELAGFDPSRLGWFDEPEPEPLPPGPLQARVTWIGEETEPKSFPIPDGLEPAGGLPPG